MAVFSFDWSGPAVSVSPSAIARQLARTAPAARACCGGATASRSRSDAMRLVLLGAPGSGKGTQAARLTRAPAGPAHFHRRPAARRSRRRQRRSGLQAKAVMARGDLVSATTILLGMLEDRFSRDDTRDGFILDGYPRNLAQAARARRSCWRSLGQPMDIAVQLDVRQRAAGRAPRRPRPGRRPRRRQPGIGAQPPATCTTSRPRR